MKRNTKVKKPVKAYGGNGRSAVYERGDGTAYMKNSGSITWRNNNPGAINSGEYSKAKGGIGNNGRFSVFPDYDTGRNAVYDLLRAKSYMELTLAVAISRYAPKKDNNDTEAYIRDVVNDTGLGRDQPMAVLTPKQRWSIVDAIIKKEIFTVGDTIPLFEIKKKYKWRTLNDKSVRESHRKREGKIFYWNNPPKGGQPGEDHGCRCWSEAYEYPRIKARSNPFHMYISG